MRAGGDDDLVGAVLQDVIGRHGRDTEVHFDVAQLLELDLAIADQTTVLRAARIARDVAPVAAELGRAVAQVHRVAALAQDHRALHAGRSRADHQHRARVGGRLELLGMPAAAVLFARGRILRAREQRLLLHARHADIAADALADVLDPPLGDLRRQEGVRDAGAGRADHVALPRAQGRDHVVGARVAALAYDPAAPGPHALP